MEIGAYLKNDVKWVSFGVSSPVSMTHRNTTLEYDSLCVHVGGILP